MTKADAPGPTLGNRLTRNDKMKRIPVITLSMASAALLAGALPDIAHVLEFSREAFARGEIWRLWTAHLTHFGAGHLRWDVGALLLLGSVAELKSRRDWVVAVVVSAPVIVLAVWWLQPRFEVYRGLSGIDCAAFGVVAGHLLREGWREMRWGAVASWVGESARPACRLGRHAQVQSSNLRLAGRQTQHAGRVRSPENSETDNSFGHICGRGWFLFALGVAACGGAVAKCGYELVTGNAFFVGATDAFAAAPLAHFAGVVVGAAAGGVVFSRSGFSARRGICRGCLR